MAEHPEPHVGVREAARALDLQFSTASRIFQRLSEEGLVRKHPESGGYALGLELSRLGQLASRKLDLRSVAGPCLRSLVAECGESVFLGMYDPGRRQMVRVMTVPSPHPLQYVVELHTWTEIYKGASGLAILAFLPVSEQEAVLESIHEQIHGLDPDSQRTRLEIELAEIRRQGYAHTRGRRIPGAVGFAAPLFDELGQVRGDVIMTVPEARFQDGQRNTFASRVRRAAREITERSGGVIPATGEGSEDARAGDEPVLAQ